MADFDAALMQKVFYVAKRQWKTDVHHHRQADDFRARLEVSEWAAFCHLETLGEPPALFNQVLSDSAIPSAVPSELKVNTAESV